MGKHAELTMQKPDLVTVETQIAHAEKKAKNATALFERVEKDKERHEETLATLDSGAQDIKERMEEARGGFVV